VYGAWVAYIQADMKQLLAYSSVSHLSFVVLGIFALNAQGISGALLQLVNYGLTTGALFLAVAALEQRYGTRRARELGGLWLVMPTFGALMLAFVLASIGLPGLNGFIGEFSVLQGTWLSPALGWRYALVAVLGVILAAVYLLSMYRHAFMGGLRAERAEAGELSQEQLAPLALLLVPMIAIGLFPNVVLGPMQPVVEQLAQVLSSTLALR
jgi:NADH-quinone oxidoreductase subunit M